MKTKQRKIIIAVCSLAVVLAVVASASFFAFFANRQKAETSITTGKIQVDLIETFPEEFTDDPDNPDDDYNEPDDKGAPVGTTKNIKGHNSGTQPAYVRVRIFPIVETLPEGSSEWVVHGGIPVDCIKYDQNELKTNPSTNMWIYNESDDYWYYKAILQPGEDTSNILIENLHVELPEYLQVQYGGDELRINMLVTLESCQSSNGLYRQNWNIENLPAGVEQ